MSGYDTDRHHRRSVRLADYDYGQPGMYFINICTHGRSTLFGAIEDGAMTVNECGRIAQDAWQAIPQHFAHVELDEYVFMPNHVHGIIVIQTAVGTATSSANDAPIPRARAGSLPMIVQAYKATVTRQFRLLEGNGAVHTTVWQSRYQDRVVRNDKELGAIRQYIYDNPLRWELDSENPSRRDAP